MIRPSAAWRRPERRGVVLLVVLALLTLFAVVGLAFVLYADSEANASRIYREAMAQGDADVPSATLLNYFLGQLIYDQSDDGTGVYSGLRGHGLARLVYGYNDDDPNSNTQAFNGTGRLHYPGPLPNSDDYSYVNYTYFPADNFLRDPERLGYRAGLSSPRGPYTGGSNGSYTYPDVNNMFLAAVQADGTVLCPSFHRPWVFNPGTGLNDTSNPHWTDAVGKYMLLRPRPAEMGPGFPYPSDPGGDVKNLVGSPGGNDSVWIDLGFPVLTMADGRKFKPMFAPLIVDLDNRVNVNVHGNVRGQANGQTAHASNQGWGPWEVSLQQVLAAGGQEWASLFTGPSGRYGPAGQPGVAPNSMAAGFPPPHFYGQADYDGCDEQRGYGPSGRASPPVGLTPFPTYAGGYGNGSAAELLNHPVLFNVFAPGPGQRVFSAGDLAQLLQAGNARGAVAGGTLASLCPTAFSDPRTRRLVTTHSFDHRAAGAVPWMYDYDPSASGYQVSPFAPDQAPSGPPVKFPSLNLRGPVPRPSGEFRGDWRGALASEKLDVNRPLPPFPNQRTGLLPPYGPAPVGPYGRLDTPDVADQYLEALSERQRLANDIYRAMLTVTAVPPILPPDDDPGKPSEAALAPRGWLAQLAANIVDYIDDDDISTPFNFYTAEDANGAPNYKIDEVSKGDAELPRYWVFGVELPRLVVNEALAEYKSASDGGYDVGLWVELHNPFQTPPVGSFPLQDSLPVPLQIPASGSAPVITPYEVVVADQVMSAPWNDNVLGKPNSSRCSTSDGDFSNPPTTLNATFQTVGTQPDGSKQQASPPPQLPPNVPYVDSQSGTTRNAFFLLAPTTPEPHGAIASPQVPAATPLLTTSGLGYHVPPNATFDDRTSGGVSVLLRRLVNPYIPYNSNLTVTATDGTVAANPWYNPYLTIDHIDKVPLHLATDPSYASLGKLQPFAAHSSQVTGQQGPGSIAHTFGQPNNPPPSYEHYDWLVHLDRQVVNPMELLQVAACQPHQLTQRFITGSTADKRFTHLAPWFDQTTRLYRLYEFLDTSDRVGWHASGAGDRVPGRVNLNTVWDPETLMALADPQGANAFTAADVTAAFNQMLALRSPGGSPGPTDRPFRSLATGVTPVNDPQHPGGGIEDTLLRSFSGQSRRLFQPAVAGGVAADDLSRHPYLQDQLLTKLFGNVTTRSNVFAVWLTVGFFQVTDDSTRPVRLGPEMGLADGRLIRHRMFAIVDRSVIGINPRPVPGFDFRNDPAVLFVGVGQ